MFENKEGQRVPSVTFRTREAHDWKNVSSDDVFADKTVIVFSLPGAFTPTCSSSHVPRFNQLAPVFKANGVDEIVCMSVNDAFVMNEWKDTQHADNITFLPDGNGAFTDGMGLLVDKEDLGFGKRSWRYAMLVRDGVIEKMFIELKRCLSSRRTLEIRTVYLMPIRCLNTWRPSSRNQSMRRFFLAADARTVRAPRRC